MADKAASVQSTTQEKYTFAWSNVDNTDTPTEFLWPGGEGFIEVTGTFDSATVQMQFGTVSETLSDLSTDEAPAGGKFTAAGLVVFTLPRGYLKPSISGGGGSQDLTVKIVAGSLKK